MPFAFGFFASLRSPPLKSRSRAVCGSARYDFFGRIQSDLFGSTRIWSDHGWTRSGFGHALPAVATLIYFDLA
ncbi:hypothetical protein SBV1_2990001 [Verrucomicrobia bacterium]|nr:hypothetical protein SBV1_2990001 [Verrucomicrobiota bacterium]